MSHHKRSGGKKINQELVRFEEYNGEVWGSQTSSGNLLSFPGL